jgi:ribose transport system substrate-binding protein
MTMSRRSAAGALVLAPVLGRMAKAQEPAPGITVARQLPAFNPAAPACGAPSDLQRTLMFAQDNSRDFMQGAARGIALAARARDLTLKVALANNDPQAMIGHVRSAVADRVGGLIVAPINAVTLAPAVREFIHRGGFVGSIVPPPATTILNAPQLATGRVLGEAAADYIKNRLGGEARVVILTHDTNQFLSQRFVSIRAALKAIPGVRIIADISPRTVDKAGGYALMRSILLAHSKVDVVLGADTVVLGALVAVREAKLDRNDQFFGGIDGEAEAIDEMKRGGPYKVSVSLASPIFGFALAQYAADWLAGKSVPQGVDILPSLLSPESVATYERDIASPDAVFADGQRRSDYLRTFGNICYDSRAQFLDFPWSSEAAPSRQ